MFKYNVICNNYCSFIKRFIGNFFCAFVVKFHKNCPTSTKFKYINTCINSRFTISHIPEIVKSKVLISPWYIREVPLALVLYEIVALGKPRATYLI